MTQSRLPPSPQTQIQFKPSLYIFFRLLPVLSTHVCVLLCLTSLFRFLPCLCLFCMCEQQSQPGRPNSFLLCQFQNPISQPGQHCTSVNGKRILREMAAGNNKPHLPRSPVDIQSIKVQQNDSSEIHYILYFWLHYYITLPKVLRLIVVGLSFGPHSDWLHRSYGDGTILQCVYEIWD